VMVQKTPRSDPALAQVELAQPAPPAPFSATMKPGDLAAMPGVAEPKQSVDVTAPSPIQTEKIVSNPTKLVPTPVPDSEPIAQVLPNSKIGETVSTAPPSVTPATLSITPATASIAPEAPSNTPLTASALPETPSATPSKAPAETVTVSRIGVPETQPQAKQSDQSPRPNQFTAPFSPLNATDWMPRRDASVHTAARAVPFQPENPMPRPVNSEQKLTSKPLPASPTRMTQTPPISFGNHDVPPPPTPETRVAPPLIPVEQPSIPAPLSANSMPVPSIDPVVQSHVADSATLPKGVETAQSIARQIAQQVPANPANGFEVALAPEELGSVKLRLIGTESGSVLIVQAERPETMDLMRRHIMTLEQDLRALGHDSLSVRFGGAGTGAGLGHGQTGQQANPQQNQAAHTGDEPRASPNTATSPPRPLAESAMDHLDLRL